MKIFLWLILNVSSILAAKDRGGPKKPHIIFCLIDDLGWNDVSMHGSRQIPTPNIDTLAVNSILLNNYYTQPLCTPSRASLMTAVHPIRYGMQHSVLMDSTPAGLSLNYTILPQYMTSQGYYSHAIGKWHLGFFHKEYTPIYRGFKSYFGYWTGKMDYYNHFDSDDIENIGKAWGKVLRRNMEHADQYNGTYSTTLFTKEAVRIIKKHNTLQPLFLYLAHQAVHGATDYELYQAPEKYIQMFNYIPDMTRRIFAATVAVMDESIGEIFRALDKKGMLDNTIFIISTDNGGEAAGYRGGVGSNWPLRGNKGTTFEGGIRGVGLVWTKNTEPRISSQLMSIRDWWPTLCGAIGENPRNLENIDGKNLWDAISKDEPSPRTELLVNIDPVENVQTIRKGDYKLVIDNYLDNMYSGWYGPSGRDNGVSDEEYYKKLRKCEVRKVLKKRKNFREVTNEWLSKLNITCNNQNNSELCTSPESPCLFNVIEDPCEHNNIAAQNPEMVAELLALLQMYNATAVPLVNQTSDPRANPSRFNYHWTNWADYL